MQNANGIKQHINAVSQTRKITNAMYLVATSRMKKAMQNIDYCQAYYDRVRTVMREILLAAGEVRHPYLDGNGSDRKMYIVLGGNRGLDGSYNKNLLAEAWKEIGDKPVDSVYLLTSGSVAGDYFASRGIEPDHRQGIEYQDPSFHAARHLAYEIFREYDSGNCGEVDIIYTSFYGKTKNRPVMRKILPIYNPLDYKSVDGTEYAPDMIYEPDPKTFFTNFVPQYVIELVYESMIQAYASEHFARMNAMESATKNADEMLKKLRLQYNLARQSAITQEITEISGSGAALEELNREY